MLYFKLKSYILRHFSKGIATFLTECCSQVWEVVFREFLIHLCGLVRGGENYIWEMFQASTDITIMCG